MCMRLCLGSESGRLLGPGIGARGCAIDNGGVRRSRGNAVGVDVPGAYYAITAAGVAGPCRVESVHERD